MKWGFNVTHSPQSTRNGSLNEIIVCDRLVEQTITFIWDSLLSWRNDPDRQYANPEEELNGQLADYLNDCAYEKPYKIKFRHEERQGERRRVDIAAKPTGSVYIRGKYFSRYDAFLLIEGKLLPAPSKDREREYVTGESGKNTGGIQRFKLGAHGKTHDVAVIVGYVQKETPQFWHPVVNKWIVELVNELPGAWKKEETLSDVQQCSTNQRLWLKSTHPRVSGCKSSTIQLHHFWIQMS